jgi:hypothetical protein
MSDDALIEAMAETAWERNREIVTNDGMEMPSWWQAKLDVKQRWRENQSAALAALRKTHAVVPVPAVDWLAQVIRRVDGSHSLGAGALAEKIVEALNASEAELARLREPAGDVGEVVEKLQAAYEKVKLWPENSSTGIADLLVLRNMVPNAADLLLRQAGEIKRLTETYTDDKGTVWDPPTAWAYYAACRTIADTKARLREAVEVIRDIDSRVINDNGDVTWSPLTIKACTGLFLAKLAPAPTPETVREDTYPDRVSMEPWPYSGHAPGGNRE